MRILILTIPDTFTAPLYGVTNGQDFGAYAKNPGESGTEESVEDLDRVGWT
jgi:hypothetical protein